MSAVLLNAFMVALGGTMGLFLKKFISANIMDSLYSIIAITIGVIGIQGAIKGENMALILIYIALGALIGEVLKIDHKINTFSQYIKTSLKTVENNFLPHALEIFLIQCTGSLAIIGPLNAGLEGNTDLLLFKTTLDFTSSIIFASLYGKSIYLSAFLLFLYEGSIFILSQGLKIFLTPEVISEISVVGSILIIAMAIDMLEIKSIKVINYIPALLLPILWYAFRLLI